MTQKSSDVLISEIAQTKDLINDNYAYHYAYLNMTYSLY